MREQYDAQLHQLMDMVLSMGAKAQGMIFTAVRMLMESDQRLQNEVMSTEDQIDSMQAEVDDRVISLITQQHPIARDARLVLVASRVASDLERMADQAINICQNVGYVLKSPIAPLPPDFPLMAEVAQKMVRDSLAALSSNDVKLAVQVFVDEERANGLRDRIFRTLLTSIITDPLTAQRSLSLVLISRNLERICDHATNVAEDAIYLLRGRDVRHRHEVRTQNGASSD
jgi:phosphate transport system protein